MALPKISVIVLLALATAIYACYQSRPRDCEELQQYGGVTATGIYTIYPEKQDGGVQVRCDMTTDGGGWTVIQMRVSNSSFYHGWNTYEKGFGNLSDNFWLGNILISKITSQSGYQLRIDMSQDETSVYAIYDHFQVFDATQQYQLLVSGYSGTAGDSLLHHNGYKFSTHDADHDGKLSNCAKAFKAAWWYASCHKSNLNGQYGSTTFGKGIIWQAFTDFNSSLTDVNMKVRKLRP